MIIIATCMAANESDVIEAFVRHNLSLLDGLVVLDHRSVDATPRIMQALRAEGLPLVAMSDPDIAFRQGERQTEMARRYLRQLEADFCFVLDADEFIRAPSRAALEASLGALPAGAFGAVNLQNYVEAAPGASGANPLRRITRRLAVERNTPHKVVLSRRFAQEEGWMVSLGNHAVARIEEGRPVAGPHALLQGVTLAHFPVRSPEQIAKKALLGWLSHRLSGFEARLPKDRKGPVPISHWGAVFADLASGQAKVDDDLRRRAIALYVGARGGAGGPPELVAEGELVDDPLPCSFDLRYAELAAPTPIAALASWADGLVTQLTRRPDA